jgi:hypothetical protein
MKFGACRFQLSADQFLRLGMICTHWILRADLIRLGLQDLLDFFVRLFLNNFDDRTKTPC